MVPQGGHKWGHPSKADTREYCKRGRDELQEVGQDTSQLTLQGLIVPLSLVIRPGMVSQEDALPSP